MTEQLQDIYEIRDYKAEDKAFVMATFLRGLYYGDSWFSQIDKDVFMDTYKLYIELLLSNGKNLVKVAVLKEDPDVILGYSILSKNFETIHWVFVKKAWRKGGIGKSLIPQFATNVTHLTTLGKSLLPKIDKCKFNPFLIG